MMVKRFLSFRLFGKRLCMAVFTALFLKFIRCIKAFRIFFEIIYHRMTDCIGESRFFEVIVRNIAAGITDADSGGLTFSGASADGRLVERLRPPILNPYGRRRYRRH